MQIPLRSLASPSAPWTRRGRRWSAWIGCGILMVLGSGCAFWQSNESAGVYRDRILPSPDALEVSSLSELPCPRADPALPETPKPPVLWEPAKPQALSGPLTLADAIDLGFSLNPQLQVLWERVEQARGGKQIAFAAFLPQSAVFLREIQGAPASEKFALPTIPTVLGNFSLPDVSDNFQMAEVNVQWTVWDFGRTPGRYGQALAGLDIAKLQYHRGRQTLAFDVAAAYFAVLETRANYVITQEAVRRADSFLRDARNYLKRGTAIRNDVLRADVLLAEMKLNLVRAQTAQRVALAALNQVIGINVSTPTQIVDKAEEPSIELSLNEALQLAVDNRDEFNVVLRALDVARLGASVARADFMPRLYAGGTGIHLDGRDLPASHDLFSGGINLEWTWFQGGKRAGQLRSADAEVRAAFAQGKDICDKIAYEVTVAYWAIDDARQRIALAKTAATQATENLRVVKSLFERGDAILTDIVDGELALTRAQQNYAAALYEYQTALARLAYAAGMETFVPNAATRPGKHSPEEPLLPAPAVLNEDK